MRIGSFQIIGRLITLLVSERSVNCTREGIYKWAWSSQCQRLCSVVTKDLKRFYSDYSTSFRSSCRIVSIINSRGQLEASLENNCKGIRGLSMIAKVAKTKIVILDGVPYSSPAIREIDPTTLRSNLTPNYPFGGPNRIPIPEDKIEWSIPWTAYFPPEFTTEAISIGDKEWADKELKLTDVGLWPKWNHQDGGINRRSHHGMYRTDADGYPLNPAGRTGIRGRGCLGRWATNHAADCIIVRWKKMEDGMNVMKEGKPVLQFIGVIRKDTGDAAFPGGMIDAGEDASTAVKREFLEEVFSVEEATDGERHELERALRNVFCQGETVFKGYVDDHRNTDNSWIETEAICFVMQDSDDVFRNLKFKAGSDAKHALWIDIDQSVKLYASHRLILERVVEKMDAYW